VFSTAPIQATKCATAANNNSNTASAIKPSSVHDKRPDLIPVTSGPLMMKMSLLIARANVMPINTNPASSPIRLPQNSLTTVDLIILITSEFETARSPSKKARDYGPQSLNRMLTVSLIVSLCSAGPGPTSLTGHSNSSLASSWSPCLEATHVHTPPVFGWKHLAAR
jgi:hypothetical protein